MEKNNSNGKVIVLLLVIIAILAVLCVLFATDTIELKTKTKDEHTNNIKENDINDNNDNNGIKIDDTKNYEEIYKSVIDEYHNVLNESIDNYYEWKTKYKYISNNDNILDALINNKMKAGYSFYDINSDGMNELLIIDDVSHYGIIGVFSYNGENVVRLFEKEANCLGDRCLLTLYNNGIIHLSGSSGTSEHSDDFYTMNKNISTLKRINSYCEVYSDDGNGNTTISIYNNDNDYGCSIEHSQKLSFTTIEEVINQNIGNATKINLNTLKWTNF